MNEPDRPSLIVGDGLPVDREDSFEVRGRGDGDLESPSTVSVLFDELRDISFPAVRFALSCARI